LLLKLTVDPDPGYAVKEVFYTYNPTTNALYAIFPKYPENNQLVLKALTLPAGTSINFLSAKENLNWKQDGENVRIQLPAYDPNKIKAPYAFAVKIGNYGMFAKKPSVKVDYKTVMQPIVSLQGNAGDIIHYTTDGAVPTAQSAVYAKPFLIDRTSTVKAASFPANGLSSGIASEKVIRYEWMKAVSPAKLLPGLSYKYYEPAGTVSLQSVENTAVTKTGVTNSISNKLKQRSEKFVLVFDGYIKIEKDGFYTFYANSDDGSKILIDGVEVVDNDGNHGNTGKNGKAALKKGFHKITIPYFDGSGENSLEVLMQAENGSKATIPPAMLFHAQ